MSNVHAMKRKPHFLYKHDPFTYSSFMLFMVERLLKNESRKKCGTQWRIRTVYIVYFKKSKVY